MEQLLLFSFSPIGKNRVNESKILLLDEFYSKVYTVAPLIDSFILQSATNHQLHR